MARAWKDERSGHEAQGSPAELSRKEPRLDGRAVSQVKRGINSSTQGNSQEVCWCWHFRPGRGQNGRVMTVKSGVCGWLGLLLTLHTKYLLASLTPHASPHHFLSLPQLPPLHNSCVCLVTSCLDCGISLSTSSLASYLCPHPPQSIPYTL